MSLALGVLPLDMLTIIKGHTEKIQTYEDEAVYVELPEEEGQADGAESEAGSPARKTEEEMAMEAQIEQLRLESLTKVCNML